MPFVETYTQLINRDMSCCTTYNNLSNLPACNNLLLLYGQKSINKPLSNFVVTLVLCKLGKRGNQLLLLSLYKRIVAHRQAKLHYSVDGGSRRTLQHTHKVVYVYLHHDGFVVGHFCHLPKFVIVLYHPLQTKKTSNLLRLSKI